MAVEVVMPRQGNTVESCLIVEWRISAGDVVKKGDILCEIETDKSTIEVEAEEEGSVLALLYEEGEDVPVLKPMLILGEPGEDVSGLTASSPSQEKADGVETGESAVPPAVATAPSDSAVAAAAPAAKPVVAAPSASGGFIAASPRAKKAAEDGAVDLQGMSGSGPGGRIIERDVQAFADSHPVVSPAARSTGARSGMTGTGVGGRMLSGEQPAAAAPQAAGTAPAAPGAQGGTGAVTEIRPAGIRKVIAERMRQSLQTTAQFTLNASADARSIRNWRNVFKTSDENMGLRGITLGDMVVFAASRILPRFPELNAEFRDGIIYQYEDVHLGLAVDTPRGLMVPVIRNANRKSLKQISDESKELSAACMAGNISPDLLSGATFTLSNLGAYGIESFSPVINAPQVAILGVCNIQTKPVTVGGEVEFLPHMGFSMTIDHQVVDGAPAARFLKEFCDFLGQFELAAAM